MSQLIIEVSEEDFVTADDEMGGWCLECGEYAGGPIEPDACNYPCDACGADEVYGAQELLLMGRLELAEG